MKMGDLFTELHDQYNTIPNPIQDKVAFHHDVYEISSRACSKDEFHSLMAKRKEQRIDELNKSLELGACLRQPYTIILSGAFTGSSGTFILT